MYRLSGRPPAVRYRTTFVPNQNNTIQTAFRAIEKRIARARLGGGIPAAIDDKSDLGDDTALAVQRSIDELGFMLRAPISALATVPFAFGLPIPCAFGLPI